MLGRSSIACVPRGEEESALLDYRMLLSCALAVEKLYGSPQQRSATRSKELLTPRPRRQRQPSSGVAAPSAQASSSSTAGNAGGSGTTSLVLSELARYSREIPASKESAPLIAGAPDDFFLLLRISPDCEDADAIKKAYRALLKQCHPDLCGEAAHDLAILLVRARLLSSGPTLTRAKNQASFEATSVNH